jgi:hypothetical protein
MITKEKHPMRTIFFRDHEISGLRPSAAPSPVSRPVARRDNSKKRRAVRVATRAPQRLWVLTGHIGLVSTHNDGWLARLITAASGGYVVVRWWRTGGRLRRRGGPGAPPVATLGLAGLDWLGLMLWAVFVSTKWPTVAGAGCDQFARVALSALRT